MANPSPDRLNRPPAVPLEDHLLRILAEMDRRLEQRFADRSEALRVSHEVMNSRLEGMNEFRSALSDTQGRMASRAELETAVRTLADKIEQGDKGANARMDVYHGNTDARLGRIEAALATMAGSADKGKDVAGVTMWLIGLTVAVVLAAAAILADFFLRR